MTDLQYLKQMPPKAHMLRFWTTSAFLLVKSVECFNPRLYRAFNFPEECSAEDISHPYDGERCSVFDSYSGLDTFELERKDGIAYRVGTAVFKEREWIQAKPQWKLITLA